MKQYAYDGTPEILLRYIDQYGKRGREASKAWFRFNKTYKREDDMQKDLEILLARGLVERVAREQKQLQKAQTQQEQSQA